MKGTLGGVITRLGQMGNIPTVSVPLACHISYWKFPTWGILSC